MNSHQSSPFYSACGGMGGSGPDNRGRQHTTPGAALRRHSEPSTAMRQVAKFHQWAYAEAFGEGWETNPPELRIILHNQENAEIVEALEHTDLPREEYLAQVAKELCDKLYVIYGTAYSLGIPLDAVFELVHISNMSKTDNTGLPVKNDYGKVLKTENYWDPIEAIRHMMHDILNTRGGTE